MNDKFKKFLFILIGLWCFSIPLIEILKHQGRFFGSLSNHAIR